MLSDRAKKWVRGKLEKWAGTFYDGPRPPDRLRDQVLIFANMNPHATRQDWVDFASGFAESVFEAAYIRGVEWAERDPQVQEQENVPPDVIADQIDGGAWRFGAPVILEFPDGIVPETVDEAQVIRDQMEEANRRGRLR